MSSKDENDGAVVNALYAESAPPEPAEHEHAEGMEVIDVEDNKSDASKFIFQVNELSYTAPKRLLKSMLDTTRRKMTEYNLNWLAPSLRAVNQNNFTDVPLKRINFTAVGGELTAIIGGSSDRYELMQLLSGRMNRGVFDGEVLLSGPDISKNSYYYEKMAFVQRVRTFRTP